MILLDLMMPVMDGWQFRQAQVQDEELAKIPVIVVSAAGRDRIERIDADAYLSKPVDLDELLGCAVFTVTSELAAFVALAVWLTALLTLPTETTRSQGRCVVLRGAGVLGCVRLIQATPQLVQAFHGFGHI